MKDDECPCVCRGQEFKATDGSWRLVLGIRVPVVKGWVVATSAAVRAALV